MHGHYVNDYKANPHPPLHPMMTEPIIYAILNSAFLLLALFTHWWFLFREEGWMDRMPRRWAGLNWWGYWIPWLVSLLIVAASYGVFFFLFVVSDDYATHNTMYHPICLCGLGFAAAGGILFPYYVRRAEHGGYSMSGSDGCQWVEMCCTCTCCVQNTLSRASVFAGLWCSVLCSLVMLMLFVIGVLSSDGRREHMELIIAALVYILFHSIVCDLMFWGHTWNNMEISNGCFDFDVWSPHDPETPAVNSSSFPWYDVPLVELRAPLVRPLSVKKMDGERWVA